MIKGGREFLLYGAASACALSVDVALLTFMHRWGVQYIIAASASFTTGAFIAYLLCVRWVFAYRRLQELLPEFSAFFGLGLIGLSANAGIIYIGVELLDLHLLLAKAAATSMTFMLNFGLRKYFLFTRQNAVFIKKPTNEHVS